MPKVNQVAVMSQLDGSGGHESCGYHTLKNTLLSMMRSQNLIDDIQFQALVKDKKLFEAFFAATKQQHQNKDVDLSLPMFLGLLERVKNGDFDFSAHGVSKADLKKLKTTPDGTQAITVANYSLYPNAPGHGLGGMEEDLLVAAATVKLARNKGVANHTFALGLNNHHWVSAVVSQNDQGERTWQFMDSWKNQALYKDAVISRIEAILSKSEPQLQNYLLSVYESSIAFMLDRYVSFFDLETGLPLPDKIAGFEPEPLDAQEFFIDNKQNMELFTYWIDNRFQFMKSVEWLTSKDEQVKAYVTQLYNMTRFIAENTSAMNPRDVAVKQRLQPIADQLKAALFPVAAVDLPVENIVHQVQTEDVPPVLLNTPVVAPVKDDELIQQQHAAIQAVQSGEPKPTEGFTARFVNAIKALIDGIVDAVRYIGQKLGLVS